MSDNHIAIKYDNFKGKDLKPRNIRIRDNADVKELVSAFISLHEDLIEATDELNKFKKHYNDDNVLKSNKLITAVQRTTKASADTVVRSLTVGGSGGSSVSVGSTIIQVSKSLTGGVTSTEVFAVPSRLLGVPIAYTTVDGMLSSQTLVPTNLTVASFDLTPLESCTVIYSYQYI